MIIVLNNTGFTLPGAIRRSAWQLQDMPYGSREFGVRDCNGCHLAFAQQASPPAGA